MADIQQDANEYKEKISELSSYSAKDNLSALNDYARARFDIEFKNDAKLKRLKEAALNSDLEHRKENEDKLAAYRDLLSKKSDDYANALYETSSTNKKKYLKEEEKINVENRQHELEALSKIQQLSEDEIKEQIELNTRLTKIKKEQKDLAHQANKEQLDNDTKTARNLKEYFNAKKKYSEEELKLAKEETDEKTKSYKDVVEKYGKNSDEAKAADAERREAIKQENKALYADFANQVANKVGEKVGAAFNDAMKKLDTYIKSFTEDAAAISASLEGSSLNFEKISSNITKNVGLSPYVTQQAILENVKKLADEGIIYNIEERAFLSTLKDKMVASFDVSSEHLQRLIKIQQDDTTALRLGLAATIRNGINSAYNDSSYMKNLYETISGAILEANSVMGRSESLEFEYQIQKWLGALSSVGASNQFVQYIASGINYLATGDIQKLSGDVGLQSLLAMSATRMSGEKSYADMLTQGLEAADVNNLMKAMVEYLQQIANSTDNLVVKSAYGNIFGFTQSDLRAIQNLSNEDISDLFGTTMSAGQLKTATQNELSMVAKRITLPQKITNIYENLLYTTAEGIGNNAITYGLWLLNNAVTDLTGGIPIPTVSIMGNSVSPNATINQLVQVGLAGTGLMGKLPDLLGAMNSKGGLNLNAWSRGLLGMRGQKGSLQRALESGEFESVSESKVVGSGSFEDIKNSTLSDAADQANENRKITNPETVNDENDFQDLYDALFKEKVEKITAKIQIESNEEYMKKLESIITMLENIFKSNTVITQEFNSNSRLDTVSFEAFIDVIKNAMKTSTNTEFDSLNLGIVGME